MIGGAKTCMKVSLGCGYLGGGLNHLVKWRTMIGPLRRLPSVGLDPQMSTP
jgi:hypothetical protein